MITAGTPPDKIVMGLAAYGHAFVMINESDGHSVFGLPFSKENTMKGEFTHENGFMGYNEVFIH